MRLEGKCLAIIQHFNLILYEIVEHSRNPFLCYINYPYKVTYRRKQTPLPFFAFFIEFPLYVGSSGSIVKHPMSLHQPVTWVYRISDICPFNRSLQSFVLKAYFFFNLWFSKIVFIKLWLTKLVTYFFFCSSQHFASSIKLSLLKNGGQSSSRL